MKVLYLTIILILGFSILFVTNQVYAPCIEGPGINCNNYPLPALTQINADKLNYETSDKPAITIIGVPYAVAHLEIDDSSSNIISIHDINLSSNGTARYFLDVSSYKPGVYSAIATSLISKLTTSFSVGLSPTGGSIVLNPDRNSYLPGDNVIIVGAWTPNTLIQLSLIDPSGISVKSIQTFSDKTGHFSSFNFTIPLNAISGIWQIGAISGVSHSQVQITINSTMDDNSNIKMDKVTILSPLKQFKSGIKADDIKCDNGLSLVVKTEDDSPACVKISSVSRLVSQGWILPHVIQVKNSKFSISYGILGGALENATYDSTTNSIDLLTNTSDKGFLNIQLSRLLIDSKDKSGKDEIWSILLDGKEIDYNETKMDNYRLVSFPFEYGLQKVVIIPYCSSFPC